MARSEQQIEAGRSPLGLWWSLIAGFVAWGIDLGLSYMLEQHSCSTGHHYVLHVISIVCLAVALSWLRNRVGGIPTLSRHYIGRGRQPF